MLSLNLHLHTNRTDILHSTIEISFSDKMQCNCRIFQMQMSHITKGHTPSHFLIPVDQVAPNF